MKRQTFTLREYESLPYTALTPETVSGLERLVQSLQVPALRFFRQELKAGHYVGVLRSGRTTLQITPKVYEHEDEDLAFLIFLLGYTRRLKIRATATAHLEALHGSFLEIWIRHFADELNTLLRQTFRREYREVQEETGYLRGKLLVERLNNGLEKVRGRFPCRYDIFTEDNPMNRVLRYCNHLLRAQTRIASTQAVLRENDILLGDVTPQPVSIEDVEGIHLNRLNRRYEPILELCRLLLQQSTLDMRAGHIKQLALLFDMNRLFEEFVAEFLRRHKTQIHLGGGATITAVRPQKALGKLFGEFSMYVDLLVTDTEGRTVLIDTKYKTLDTGTSHHGLSQGDFYQMFGYARAGAIQHEEIVLLYPEGRAAEQQYRSGSVNLHVRTVDLRTIWDPQKRRLNRQRATEEMSRALTFRL